MTGTVPRLPSAKEESNYAHLCRILVTMGSGALRDTFDSIIPPQSLQEHLKGYQVRAKLQSLRKQGVLNSRQWNQLYPDRSSSVSSKSFDPTLLTVLLRTICKLTPPTAGWDAPPHAADITRQADIARVRYFMSAVHDHAKSAYVRDAEFVNYLEDIRGMLVRLGGAGYGDAMEELKNSEMDPVTKEHYQELLKQWNRNEDYIMDKMNELESIEEACRNKDIPYPSHVLEGIRQVYKTREERLLPVPWCEDFSFHLNDIFTRLRIISKEKTRGALAEEITNMTAIFKAPEGCPKPRTVLIEGDPGMGKTTYCQKLAYDWANGQDEWDESFPEIELLLLLRCHDIKSNLWDAIEEQILPEDIDKESKDNFFKFIRENQSKVLLVLDGLDEADPSKLDMYIKLVESRELAECRIVLTTRHEAGKKFRRICNTLWEIVGFTKEDAESFIFKYFRNNTLLANKLLQQLSPWSGSKDLLEMMSNPLNIALLCVLCEDFEGVFPASRTQLYIEIVLCVLRRYEKKNALSSNNDDLISVYKVELSQLGLMALKSLLKGELHIEESECGSNPTALTKFGFLSVQPGGTRRKPSQRYGFLHKSFQEFFAGFFLASQILSREISLNSLVNDRRYLNEQKPVFHFMSGILALHCEKTAESLVKRLTKRINYLGQHGTRREVHSGIMFAFDCIKECITCKETLQTRLLDTFGSCLSFETFQSHLNLWDGAGIAFFIQALSGNTTMTSLDLRRNDIGNYGATSLSKALSVANTALTSCDLSWNGISDSGACSLSRALGVNNTLSHLKLRENKIGDTGASSLFEVLTANTTLAHLCLSANRIGDGCAGSLSKALKTNAALTELALSYNMVGDCGAHSLSEGLSLNTTLINLDLTWNKIRFAGAGSLSQALTLNTTLTRLDLSSNWIGNSGAASLSEALKVNTGLTHLNLKGTMIGNRGACSLSEALTLNTSLTNLDLLWNKISDSGAGSLANALTVNTKLTRLNLSWNKIGYSGAGSLAKALTLNTTLTQLNLSSNRISSSGFDTLFYDHAGRVVRGPS